jgi:hypothetical protein
LGQVVLTAGLLSRATWSMLMSRRPVQRARPSLVWVERRGVPGPFSDPGGQYSQAVSDGVDTAMLQLDRGDERRPRCGVTCVTCHTRIHTMVNTIDTPTRPRVGVHVNTKRCSF